MRSALDAASARTTLLAAGLVASLAAANGGYYPTAWGWASLALLWVTALSLVLRDTIRLSRLELGTLTALAALLGWFALSTLWSVSASRSVLESERALVYVAGLAAALLVVRSRSYRALLGGVWGATVVVCLYSLATRLLPERLGVFDPIAGYRLSEPIGYWNGLGLFAALGSLLALGLAARARNGLLRGVATGSLLVLAPTLYFTFSRGAWIALAVGLVATVALDPRRLQLLTTLLVAGPWPVLGVWLASRSEALTTSGASLASASRDGHRLALVLAALALGGFGATVALAALERRLRFGKPARLAYAGALGLVVLAALVVVFARYGSPPTLARNAYDSFTVRAPPGGTNLNTRLFSLSGNGRDTQWKAAWHDFEDHPGLGSGAGTYEQYWLVHRPYPGTIRDAHSLYLENLGELGPVGLGLLAVALGLPLAAAARARRRALVPAALGAYVAYLVHAAVDWDWELSGVTLAALLCAAALLSAARRAEDAIVLGPRVRYAGVAAALGFAVFAVVGLLGNSALSAGASAASDGRWAESETQARKALRWAPWSSDPWQMIGEAQLARKQLAPARASFRKAIAKDPHDWELWTDLALASKGAARRRYALKALELNPLSPEINSSRPVLGLPPSGG